MGILFNPNSKHMTQDIVKYDAYDFVFMFVISDKDQVTSFSTVSMEESL